MIACVAAGGIFSVANLAYAQTSPTAAADAVASLKVRPGFSVELAASEPMVADPVAAAFDENGRLFVLEYPQYNEDWAKAKSPRRGRVRLLVDEDDDGIFDKVTTYTDELDNPMSVACGAGGVYSGGAPDVWYFRDSDGDGVADEKRKVFTGFGAETNRAGYAQLNSFVWGLDNRYHACTNYAGGDVRRVDQPESDAVSVRGRGFVFDPRDESFDTGSGGGQHGMCFDDWGNQFTCRNSDPVEMYFYDDRRLRGNDYLQAPAAKVSILTSGKYTPLFRLSADEEWRVIRTKRRMSGEFKGGVEGGGKVSGYFTAATGITIYRGDAWPAKYRGSSLTGEASNNLVFRAELKRDGVGFAAERAAEEAELGVEFIASADNAFRPVQFVNAPDGNLLMLDMYRHLIEGAAFLPPDVVAAMEVLGGSGMGRVYRIKADSGVKRRPTPKLGEASTQELVALLGHKNAWHRETASRLLYERQDAAAEAGLRKLVAESDSPLAKVHAAWALRGMGLEMEDEIMYLLDESGRVEVLRQGVLLGAEKVMATNTWAGMSLLANSSKRVRYAVAMELDKVEDATVRRRWIADALFRDPDDLWLRAAAMSSLRNDAGHVALRLADLPPEADGTKTIFQSLARQVGERSELDDDDFGAMLSAVEVVSKNDKSLARSIIGTLLETRHALTLVTKISESKGGAAELLGGMLTSAQAVAFDPGRTEAERVTAISRLRLKGIEVFRDTARQLLDSAQPGAVQTAAIDTLGSDTGDEIGRIILDSWKGLAPTARERALGVLMRRKAWVATLLDAVESGQVTRADLGATRIAALSAHGQDEISGRAKKVFSSAGFAGRDEVVATYQPALTMTGDADRGKVIFGQSCAACHQLDGVGQEVGAQLAGIMIRGADSVMLNILDPNREVHADFLLYSVSLKDGAVETGMIRFESSSAIKLRRIDGSEVELLRVDIDKVTSLGTSFMPEGLEAAISVQGMADLLTWMKSLD